MMIEVLDGGYFSSIQDLGRIGWGQSGVPRSGAMDEFALRAANRLVGNSDNCAAIEVGLGGIRFRVLENLLIAVCGRGFSLWLEGQKMSLWQSFMVRAGQIVQVTHEGGGMWAVIGVHGGIDVDSTMGSRATYLVGGFGGWFGRLLREGDQLPIGKSKSRLEDFTHRFYPEAVLNDPATPVLRVVIGPHSSLLDRGVYDWFFQNTFLVSLSSNRVGYRLQGEVLKASLSGDLISVGMLPGAIQLTPQGELIVMMADSPVSGGYPIIGVLIRADIPILAQCEPLTNRVRFVRVSPENGREAYAAMLRKLDLFDNFQNSTQMWQWAGAIQ
ncbi:MAG: biotin-dependent carboxyltransferase family protein [Chloroflexota bacterium]